MKYLDANLLYEFFILMFRCTTHISSLKITWPIVLSRPWFVYVTYAMAQFYYSWRLSRPSEFNKFGSNRVTKVLTCSEQHSRSRDVKICNGTVQEPLEINNHAFAEIKYRPRYTKCILESQPSSRVSNL